MKLDGVFRIEAPRDTVWELLNDPEALARSLPGCERLTRLDDNRFEGVLTVGIAAITSTYTGSVAMSDIRPLEGYTLDVNGEGNGGFVKGRGIINLADDAGQTSMTVSGDAQIGGRIAGVGQRLLDGAARKVLREFAAALGREATARLERDFRGFRP